MKKIRFWPIFRTILIATILAVFFRSYLFASYIVDGKSMEPTLHDGNLLMVNRMIYDFADIDRFDVIVFHANEEEDYVKRVIGEPGDSIEYINDTLYVNGKAVDEAYLKPFRQNDGTILTKDFTLEEITGKSTVPAGKLFVLGDNRRKSLDSRNFGFIDADSVVGKVDIRYWPVSEVGFNFTK
ncbi:signal peptidase I [Aquibacillus koreensis]|uniref:Signal peptidase I n=1 Tax=Aquibacillus koreensis TaxID=279446 RepID=A0A9X4AHW2_9BACI|nr:signal peptidase I [Aquibacillus koreensis]MCT2535601.1 signal peptidase I [Aquibacillus koreensis]MDC3420114.1 signal peptidase I [Aquibacillus koreensis]